MRLDGQGVDALGDQMAQGIIHKAMSGDSGQAREALARDAHGEMASFSGAGMARMQVAVVDDFEGPGLQRARERRFVLAGGDRHSAQPLAAGTAVSSSSMCRASQKACTTTKAIMIPVSTKTLKFTQVSVGKVKATHRLRAPTTMKNSA